jgi:hypothetical protein
MLLFAPGSRDSGLETFSSFLLIYTFLAVLSSSDTAKKYRSKLQQQKKNVLKKKLVRNFVVLRNKTNNNSTLEGRDKIF